MNVAPVQPVALWPLVVYFFAVIGLVCLMLGLAWIAGERRDHSHVKHPFESGIIPLGHARFRLSVHFYLVAVFFVLFDLETVFILAWAIAFRQAGWLGFIEILIFIGALVTGLIYIWRQGALDWAPREGRAARPPIGRVNDHSRVRSPPQGAGQGARSEVWWTK